LDARAEHVEDAKLISPEYFDGDLDDSELTEEDLEIIKP
jgi:membrane-associated HD superfamily phosphohydrolase